MGVFVYKYPRTGSDKGPAPWAWMVHSPIHHCHGHHDSFNESADCDQLATPGRRWEDKPRCKVEAWLADRDLRSHWKNHSVCGGLVSGLLSTMDTVITTCVGIFIYEYPHL